MTEHLQDLIVELQEMRARFVQEATKTAYRAARLKNKQIQEDSLDRQRQIENNVQYSSEWQKWAGAIEEVLNYLPD